MREAHVPTEQPQARQDPRVPRADVDPRRACRHQGPAPQGAQAADGLIWRVRDRATFRAFAGGVRSRRGLLALSFVAGDDSSVPPRVAYAVSRKVGPAVVRNRVRRRLRHAVAARRHLLVPGGAYLVIARPGLGASPWAELDHWTGELLASVPARPPAPDAGALDGAPRPTSTTAVPDQVGR